MAKIMLDYHMPGDIRTWGTYVPEEAIERATEVLNGGWLNTGKNEKLLREIFCDKFNFVLLSTTAQRLYEHRTQCLV